MSELTRTVEDLREVVKTDWSDERAGRIHRAMTVRRRRRTAVRAAVSTMAIATVFALGWITWLRLLPTRETPHLATTEPAADPGAVQLPDGSRIELAERGSQIRRKLVSQRRIEVEVLAGSASFDVTPNPDRVFRVESGPVGVEVLGTAFTVQRLRDGALVSVQRGHVRVTWDGGETDLTAGSSGRFPPPPGVKEPDPASVVLDGVPAPKKTLERPMRSTQEKTATNHPAGPESNEGTDEVSKLMYLADAARAGSEPARAIKPLQQVVENYPTDPVAPVAAFTLGRVMLSLNEPRKAAEAFAKARQLDPAGALAEDALAREIECWAKAGDQDAAEERAKVFLKFYPTSPRAEAVRSWGGLE
jgi:transmembrane sensor